MGFNIGVHSEEVEMDFKHYRTIERNFYNFVCTGERFGDKSVLIRSGQYYKLDLSPLLKLVYTTDEVTEEEKKENLQSTEALLKLVSTFRSAIQEDDSVCDNIDYQACEESVVEPGLAIEQMLKGLDPAMAAMLRESLEESLKEQEDPNPWKSYFEEGELVKDLTDLIYNLEYYRSKGAREVFLTAG